MSNINTLPSNINGTIFIGINLDKATVWFRHRTGPVQPRLWLQESKPQNGSGHFSSPLTGSRPVRSSRNRLFSQKRKREKNLKRTFNHWIGTNPIEPELGGPCGQVPSPQFQMPETVHWPGLHACVRGCIICFTSVKSTHITMLSKCVIPNTLLKGKSDNKTETIKL